MVVGTPTWREGMWLLLHKCLHRAEKPHGLQFACFCPRTLSKQKRLWPVLGEGEDVGSNLFRLRGSQLHLDFSRANHWPLQRKQWSSPPLTDVMQLLAAFSKKLTMKNIKNQSLFRS